MNDAIELNFLSSSIFFIYINYKNCIQFNKRVFFVFLQRKLELEIVANRRSNALAWVGLGLMSVQFGILARLTWWEYSWDIMEPVTYFVTYGTAMAAYAYFVLTREVD